MFHGYGRSIQAAFRDLGHQVELHEYDALATLAAKARHKLRYELPEKLGTSGNRPARVAELTAAARAAVEGLRPEVVVVVKGDLLDADFAGFCRSRGCRSLLWLYDDMRRLDHSADSVRAYDSVATYAAADLAVLAGEGIAADLVRVGFDHHMCPADGAIGSSIVFVGARYPERTLVLEELVDRGLPVLAYGRDWSHAPWDRLRTWDPRRPSIPAAGDVSLARAIQVMGLALLALNVHGPNQNGFNTRTFEAGGAGALQAVDRSDVGEVYCPGSEVCTFADVDELVELAHRAAADPRWARGIRDAARRRTLAEHTYVHRCRQLERLW